MADDGIPSSAFWCPTASCCCAWFGTLRSVASLPAVPCRTSQCRGEPPRRNVSARQRPGAGAPAVWTPWILPSQLTDPAAMTAPAAPGARAQGTPLAPW